MPWWKNKVEALLLGLLVGGLALSGSSALSVSSAYADSKQIQELLQQSKWNDAAETSFQNVQQHPQKNPETVLERVLGGYALFQKGDSNAALLWLKPLTAADWKSIPEGSDRLAEIMVLFQKKVPLNALPGRLEQLSPEEISSGLRDEINFARGRAAFERRTEDGAAGARKYLNAINPRSRYFAQAHYLLGALDAAKHDYKNALAEFSKIFDAGILDQSTEFWKDVGAQASTHWGSNVRVDLDSTAIAESSKVAELSVLGMARADYALKDFESALAQYQKIAKTSPFYKGAVIERIWTLLALNRHEQAQQLAAELATGGDSFEALEARPLRALVLTDVGRTTEAREELAAFAKSYDALKSGISNFESTRVEKALPPTLRSDLTQDTRLAALRAYQEKLIHERDALRQEDTSLFRFFAFLSGQLDPLLLESKNTIDTYIQEHVAQRSVDLEDLFVQSKLILAESYLEDREKLRDEFQQKDVAATQSAAASHDSRLAELLNQAVAAVDEVLPRVTKNKVRLEARQAELLWDLASAREILSMDAASMDAAGSKKEDKESERQARELCNEFKQKSMRYAQDIVSKHPDFEGHAKAMFFLGYAQSVTGQVNLGYKTLEAYLKKYPKDKYAPDAYRILGDAKFDENQFRAAEELYRKVLEFPESPIVGYALYKIGWCAYNLKDFARALLGLEKAVLWANSNTQENHLLTLKKESRHDLISLYAEVGDHKKAFDYFSKFFQGDATAWVEDLAKELDRVGQFEKSMDLYKTLMAVESASIENIARQAAIIRGEYKLRKWDNLVAAAQKLLNDYKPSLEEPQTDETKPSFQAEKALHEAMLGQLFEYKRAPAPEALARIDKLDDLYLSAFARWPQSEEPLYRHAQFLLDQKKFDLAADAFRKHWAQFKPTLKEPLREEALRNLIHSLDKGEAVKTSIETQNELLDRTAEYAQEYPNTKQTRPILFLRSALLLKQGKTEEGIKLSQALFDADPADDVGKGAFKNLRLAYYDLKDWKRAYEWATAMNARTAPAVKMYANELRAVREETLFLWADGVKDDSESAGIFLKVADDPSMPKLREKALYNAFVRLDKAGKTTDALAAADRMEKIAPASDLLGKISGVRAALYQEAGEYAAAMPLLSHFLASPESGTPQAALQQARFNLALIQEGEGLPETAEKNYKEFLKGEEDTNASRYKESQRGLARLERARKAPAEPVLREWPAMLEKSDAFRKAPVPRANPKAPDLAGRIKKGAEQLEATAKMFLDAATNPKTPEAFAFESYCSVPFLYAEYGAAVRRMGDENAGLKTNERADLKRELDKIMEPIDAKAKVMADQCIKKSWEARHDGPQYRAVLKRWGWAASAVLEQKVGETAQLLGARWPWFDSAPSLGTEKQILQLHFDKKASEDSWYALAMARWKPNNAKAMSETRLTLVDALIKYPNSGRILNALACVDYIASPEQTGLFDLFQKAATQGSKTAYANLAYWHLKGARLDAGVDALHRAADAGVFEKQPELAQLAKELNTK